MALLYAVLDKIAAGLSGPGKDYVWIVTVLLMLGGLLFTHAWSILSIKRDVKETGARLAKLERRVKRNAKLGKARNESLDSKVDRICLALNIPTPVE